MSWTWPNDSYSSADERIQAPHPNSFPGDEMQQQHDSADGPNHFETTHPVYYPDDYGPNMNAVYSQNHLLPTNASDTHGSSLGTEQRSAYVYVPLPPDSQSSWCDGISGQLQWVQYNGGPSSHVPQTCGRRSSQIADHYSSSHHSYSVDADFVDSTQCEAAYDAFENFDPEGGDDGQYPPQETTEQSEERSEYSMDVDLDQTISFPTLVALNSEPALEETHNPPWSAVNNRQDCQHLPELNPQLLDRVNTLGANDTSGTRWVASRNAIDPELSTSPSSFSRDVNSMEDSQITVTADNTSHGLQSKRGNQQPPTQHGYRGQVPDVFVQENTPELDGLGPSGLDGTSLTPSAAGCLHPPLPDPLRCKHCRAKYTGIYRVGNLGRHYRQKHRDGAAVSYICEDQSCRRVFARKDARLKHYRKHHEELVSSSSESRGHHSHVRGSRVASQPLDSPSGGESQYGLYPHRLPNEDRGSFMASNGPTFPQEQMGQRDQDLRGLTYD